MTGKFKKYISILLIIFLALNTFWPAVSFAQETTEPTPTPTLEPEQTPNPTPTLTSTSAPMSASNSATVTNDVTSNGNTGGNLVTIATPSAEVGLQDTGATEENNNSTNPSDSSIETGDAVSVSTTENSVNSTSVNSEVLYQTINIYAEQIGDLDFAIPFNIANEALLKDQKTDPVINIALFANNNYAYLENNISSSANTGINSANGVSIITTGDAISATSLLNKVNFTVVGSKIHIITINIFGKLNGNIILPDIYTSQHCTTCEVSISSNNSASVINNVTSTANSGENSIEATTNGEITTGNANSTVNVVNLVNNNYYGVTLKELYINLFGSWSGSFLGWSDSNFNQGASLTCDTCVKDVNVNNQAMVVNNVLSIANSGGNSINGNGEIITGNAYSAVSIINLINSTFINSIGFFGFVNIFGDWIGNIGGEKEFIIPDSEDSDTNNDNTNGNNSSNGQGVEKKSDSDNKEVREDGGLLEVTQSNNVGSYVLQGDTVTFFVNVKNSGSGKVYETKLKLYLLKNSEVVGGTVFDLGAIGAKKTVKLSTGFVLSKTAPTGEYIAVALAEGVAGEENNAVSAHAESTFKILSQNILLVNSEKDQKKPAKEVLAAVNKPFSQKKGNDYAKLYLLFVLVSYTGLKILRKREVVPYLVSRGIPAKIRFYALRSILL